MIRLTPSQINEKIDFIQNYIKAGNAASASSVDANANVTSKNIATMEAEINKDINIQINRELVRRKIADIFDEETANEYVRQIENHEIYVHDETSLKPYCVSISMYPFLLDGLLKIGGESRAPKHLESFCGEFVNLVFAVSSQFAGALATVEFLLYFDHFAAKDFGENYLKTNTKTTCSMWSMQSISQRQRVDISLYSGTFRFMTSLILTACLAILSFLI